MIFLSNKYIDLPDDFSEIESVYHLTMAEEESVAMLPAYVISIKPKDFFRYSRKVWIDKEHFLPLKSEVYDLLGKMVEQVVFTEIKIGNKLAFFDLGKEVKDASIKHLQQAELLSIDKADFVLQNLPLNYHVVFFTRMIREGSVEPAEHVLLSDGFSSVSVYKEAKDVDTQEGLQTLGSVKSFTQIINGFQITVLGEVPVKTVKFIAQGIKLK